MAEKKDGYARYTFAFAADLQKLADERHIKVDSFRTSERHNNKKGSYDYLLVGFVVPRPDRDAELAKKEALKEIEPEATEPVQPQEIPEPEIEPETKTTEPEEPEKEKEVKDNEI